MKKKKHKHKIKKKIKIIIFILLVIILSTPIVLKEKNKKELQETKYLASSTKEVTAYIKDKEGILKEKEKLIRGTEIKTRGSKEIIEETTYQKVYINKNTYYIKEENLVTDKNKIVQEEKIYDRTPTYILEDLETAKISGLAKKEDELQVLGYNKIQEDGEVDYYYIQINDIKGYVKSNYITRTKEESAKNYEAETYDQIHSKVADTFNGGKAINLDFYPEEKQKFQNNIMPDSVYALYLNNGANVIKNIDDYIELAKDTKINAFVLDIKDNETPGYPANTFKELSPTNYERAINSYDDYKNAVTKLKEAGFYVIGRITTFKDNFYIQDHKEDAITNKQTNEPYLHTGSYWPSPYSRNVWYYTVSLAKEAVKEFGFNEINFDYVRFPDRMQSVENNVDLLNTYNEDKSQAIQRFVQYATDELHKLNTYVSIDVFGESTNGTYMTAYGQYWPAISNVADVICGMPYPDHFSNGYYGINKPWNNPYKLLNTWARYAKERQDETPSAAKARTWIQAYDVMKYVDPSGISYNAEEVEQEIRALYEGGLDGGYITWLSNSNLEKYKAQKKAYQIDYLKEYQQ